MSLWSCDVCLTENDHEDPRTQKPRFDCEACETERPGYTKPKDIIKEGSSAISGDSAAILFGAKPDKTDAGSTLSFGSAPAASAPGPIFGSAHAASAPGPIFGSAPAASAPGPIFGSAPAASAPGPIFGSAPATSAPKTSSTILFGSTSATAPESTNPVIFGDSAPSTPTVSSSRPSGLSMTPTRGGGESQEEAAPLTSKLSARIEVDESFQEDDTVKKGKILVWGSGECDQLPFSDDLLDEHDGVLKATSVAKLEKYDVTDVQCGALHTVALLDTSRVISFGCNDEGALGREVKNSGKERFPGFVTFEEGKPLERAIAISAGNSHSLVVQSDGSVIVMGQYKASSGAKARVNGLKSTQKIEMDHKAIAVDSGNEHSIAICEGPDNTKIIYAWGVNEYGALGRKMDENPSDEDLTKSIVPTVINPPEGYQMDWAWAGANTTVLRVKETKTGEIAFFACGCNGTGEVGVGSSETVVDELSEIKELRGLKIKKFVLADYAGKALLEDGTLYAWGHPDYLGQPNPTNSRDPVKSPKRIIVPKLRTIWSGGRTNIASLLEGSRATFGWGDSMTGQLLEEVDAPVDTLKPLDALKNKIVVACGIGSQHVCAVIADPSQLTAIPAPSRKRQRSVSEEIKEKPNEENVKRQYPARLRKTVPKF